MVEQIMTEVEECAGLLARKKRLAEDLALLVVSALVSATRMISSS